MVHCIGLVNLNSKNHNQTIKLQGFILIDGLSLIELYTAYTKDRF